ncbi:unnamed protein product [Gongylonema pulchrum]|uniref:ABC-2 type transporter transmembrane domain-containing protein n=1 Tax=Gongylonema pulchrum TaxID=637853 RepID=A0A183DJ92_9BILA|nr:unnamed protein product [Gongylonema pulchrum]
MKIFNLGLQMLCGLRHWMYWLTAFIWDYAVFLIPASLCMIVYISRSSVGLTLYLIMLLYGWAELPFVYFCSILFDSPTKGNATICVYNFMTGLLSGFSS